MLSDCWMETATVLVVGYLVMMLDGIIVFAICSGVWPVWFVVPPVMALHYAVWHLWKTRPSING